MSQTSPQFWDRLAEKYAAQPIENEAAYQHKLDQTRKRLTKQMDVLEFACGTGGTAIYHAPTVKSYLAIDYSNEMIRIARAKPEGAQLSNLTFDVESIDTLNAPDESFDAILGMSILHLLPNRIEVMEKVHRLLKPGGCFVSSTTCIRDMNPLAPLVISVMRFFGKAPFVGLFSGDALVTEMEQIGFSIDEQWCPKKDAALFVIARKD